MSKQEMTGIPGIQDASHGSGLYTPVAVALHWIVALMILSMIPMGWWMARAIAQPETQHLAYQIFQLHKSVGLLILGLSVFRVAWRLTHSAPPQPESLTRAEQFAAHAVHYAFYGFMILIPLTGWIYVSSGWAVPLDRPFEVATTFFGLFDVPKIAPLAGRPMAYGSMGAHRAMAYGALVLVLLHVGAALKHQFVDRDDVLARMIPVLRLTQNRGNRRQVQHRGASAAAIGIGAIVVFAAVSGILSLPRDPAIQQTTTEAMSSSSVANSDSAAPVEREASTPFWDIDRERSSIAFSGTHAGKVFVGHFRDWSGVIRFDPKDLKNSSVTITVQTGSARTGDATQEGSLKNGEWFNSARFPDASFRATSFRSTGADEFEADGTLTIKGRGIPVVLPFLLRIDDQRASVKGSLKLDRARIDLGMFSDAAGEWVSKNIDVTVKVEARRLP